MNAVRPREDRTAAGVMAMALAVFFFTCIDTSAKWLSLAGLPVMQIVFCRYAGHLVYSLMLYLPQEGTAVFRSNAPKLQLLRSFFLLASTMLNFAALKFLPITLTTTLAFAGPIVVTLLAIPILGEKVGPRRIATVCLGFVGVVVVVQPWNAAFHPAIFFSLASLSSASLYFIMTRMLAGVETNAVQQVWSSGLATLVLIPLATPVWIWPDNPVIWAVMLCIGGFGLLGHVMAAIAHRWADASILAPVIYVQIFLAVLVGIFLFDTWPTTSTAVGGLIIVVSGIYIRKLTRAEAQMHSGT